MTKPKPPGIASHAEAFRSELAEWYDPQVLLAGCSPAVALARQQVLLAAQHRLGVVLHGSCAADLAATARAIHYRTYPRGDHVLTEVDAYFATPERLAELRTVAPPPTLVLLQLQTLPTPAQRDLAQRLSSGNHGWLTVGTCCEGRLVDELQLAIGPLAVRIPNLGQRGSDFSALVAAMITASRTDAPVPNVSREALEVLAAAEWPGGMTQLRLAIDEACQRVRGSELLASHLPRWVNQAVAQAATFATAAEPIDLEAALIDHERRLITAALAESRGNRARAARLLGMPRARLYRRLLALGLAEPTASGTEQIPPAEFTPLDDSPPEFIEE